MSSAISGKAGDVTWSGSDLVEVQEWSINYVGETADVTSFDSSGNHENLATIKSWDGKFKLLKTAAPPIAMHASATLQLKESQTAGQLWSGTAIITNIGITASANGAALLYDYSFIGTGALTVPTA